MRNKKLSIGEMFLGKNEKSSNQGATMSQVLKMLDEQLKKNGIFKTVQEYRKSHEFDDTVFKYYEFYICKLKEYFEEALNKENLKTFLEIQESEEGKRGFKEDIYNTFKLHVLIYIKMRSKTITQSNLNDILNNVCIQIVDNFIKRVMLCDAGLSPEEAKRFTQ